MIKFKHQKINNYLMKDVILFIKLSCLTPTSNIKKNTLITQMIIRHRNVGYYLHPNPNPKQKSHIPKLDKLSEYTMYKTL